MSPERQLRFGKLNYDGFHYTRYALLIHGSITEQIPELIRWLYLKHCMRPPTLFHNKGLIPWNKCIIQWQLSKLNVNFTHKTWLNGKYVWAWNACGCYYSHYLFWCNWWKQAHMTSKTRGPFRRRSKNLNSDQKRLYSNWILAHPVIQSLLLLWQCRHMRNIL